MTWVQNTNNRTMAWTAAWSMIKATAWPVIAGAKKAARYRSRPDAAMVQAETSRASVKGKGLKCPKCHCQNFRVLATRPGEDSKTRRRICKSCGYVFHTCEFVTSDLTPESLLEAMARKHQQ